MSRIFASIYDFVNTCDISQLDAILVALFVFTCGCGLLTTIFVSSWLEAHKSTQPVQAASYPRLWQTAPRQTYLPPTQPYVVRSYDNASAAYPALNQPANANALAGSACLSSQSFGAPRQVRSSAPWYFGQAAAAIRTDR